VSQTLTIEPLGQSIEVASGQTILDAALRAGIWLPHACGHGLCATCKVHVVDGEVEHGDASPFALMDFEREEGKALACCATLASDVIIEVALDEEADAEHIPVRDFPGIVTRIEELTPTIRGIWITLESPLHFQAGQYVNLSVPALGLSRAFSLSNPPDGSKTVELNIRRVPGGPVTEFLHEQLRVGDALNLSGPYGRFFVRRSAQKPMIFMAGGSGLSSPRSMIVDLLSQGCALPVALVYGQRQRSELYYHEQFLELAQRYPQFQYLPTLSHEPQDSEWRGARGFVHDAAAAHFQGDFRGHQAYLCGPPPMIEACVATLMRGRLFEESIYTEKFLSAADAQSTRSPLFRRI